MGFPTYQLHVWEVATNTLKTIIPVQTTFNLTYTRIVSGIGVIAFTMTEEDGDIRDIFADDNIIDVKRVDPNGDLITEESYFVRTYQRVTAENGLRAVIGGLSLNSLLMRHIVDPEDDSVQPNGGFATKAGDAMTVIRAYVREQLGDLASASRQAPRFSVPGQVLIGQNVGANLRHQNLWVEMRKLAISGGVDLQVVHDGSGNLELEIKRLGTDKSVTTNIVPPYLVFSPDRGNLRNPSVKIDRRKEQNVIYGLGDGEGANRILIKTIGSDSSDTIYNRIEATLDVRDAAMGDLATIQTQSAQLIISKAPLIEFEFELVPDAGGATYRVDWFLGDTATFIWDVLRDDRRIVGISVTLFTSGEKIDVTLSEVQ